MAETNNIYNGEITEKTDWGGDASTGFLPVSGAAVQKWIKDTFRGKFGYFRKRGTQFHIILELFRDKQAALDYDANPQKYQNNRQVVEFDVPDSYTKHETDNALNRKAEKTAIPTRVGQLYNDKGYINQHQDISGKVDKVPGKRLSTNDFTNILKEKLESLENYDDSDLKAAVQTLRREFDTLVSGDASIAIDTFNDIIAFLDGITDNESLDSIVAGINSEIARVRAAIPRYLSQMIEDANHRHVTDGEKNKWNAKLDAYQQNLQTTSKDIAGAINEVENTKMESRESGDVNFAPAPDNNDYASRTYVDGIVGELANILDAVNGEVI